MAVLLAILCLVAPYANLPVRHITAFIPVYATAMAIIDLVTAALIFAQFWVVRWTWLLVLGCGFFFTGLISVSYGLTFPEGFAPSGLLGAGAQTSAQLSLCSRVVSPVALIIAILVRETHGSAGIGRRSTGLAILSSVVLVCAIVGGLTWAILANDQILPRIYVNRLQNNLHLLLPIIALTAVPLVLLCIRGRSVLDLWLMVMCCSWLFDLSLVMLAGSRYSVGWYTARAFQVGAIFFVLLLFLSEATALYANLARTSVQRRGARHARHIAMDVMAASLGHEIKQPLAALLIDAEAGMLLLRNAEPNLEEIRATFSDIAADAERIKSIISGVRTMFKESSHDRQLLDINKVIRDALATVDFDLRKRNIATQAELDNEIPPVFADRGQLHQMFLNLITNALEAMPSIAGRPSVLRVASAMVPNSSDIAVTVEDTGVGIPDGLGRRVFEPFFSTKTSGSGIGLTICEVILKAHGGSLQVGTNKPYGTIVRVILPSGGDE